MYKKSKTALLAACFSLASINAAQSQSTLVADSGFAAPPLAKCHTDLRYLNQVGGWQATWPSQWERIRNSDMGARESDLAHWTAAPESLSLLIEKLNIGIQQEETAPREVVLRIQQQLHDLTAALEARDKKYFFSDKEKDAGWNNMMIKHITPAIKSFSRFIDSEYLPAARTTPGLFTTKNGTDCFANATEWWTTLRPTKKQLKKTGKRLMRETRDQLLETGEDGETFQEIMTRLRSTQKTDPTTAEELIALSVAALARAEEKTLTMFSKKARSTIQLVTMPEHLQASFPAGRYNPPTDRSDPNSPGSYVINPSRPGERRLMAEVIAFHEGIPGHHLFFDYPRETPSAGYNSGILEGWAIYSEFVADEMELYSSTFDRQGMITKHLWATSRLVVEPGIHLDGWSREEAVTYMLENTVMSRKEIEIEVDRYIAMPGQSLSYMLGADLMLSERKRAQQELGDDFDIRAFHDVILSKGVRSLPQLRDDIRSWVKSLL